MVEVSILISLNEARKLLALFYSLGYSHKDCKVVFSRYSDPEGYISFRLKSQEDTDTFLDLATSLGIDFKVV